MRTRLTITLLLAAAAIAAAPALSRAWADPCGMVPPVQVRHDPDRYLTRIGDQLTWVFFKDGVEDVMLRPAFEGRVSEFGMLIPFPSVPAVRKVPEDIFYQVRSAIEPPTVDINIQPVLRRARGGGVPMAEGADEDRQGGRGLGYNEVEVHREEAVGMYQVAVLEAGSTQALERWMGEHDYVYPDGMDAPVADYVDQGWVFVAIKARVGSVAGVQPTPGMRDADPTLPEDATFDGAVQAMGFRFRVEAPVVPMRLSAYNPGELHNIVYFLTDGPARIAQLPDHMVTHQVSGRDLLHNMTRGLPANITYWDPQTGESAEVHVRAGERPRLPDQFNTPWALGQIAQQRDPEPHNGRAREQIAADLLAVERGVLELDFEAEYKRLLNLSEELDMRGPALDDLLREAATEHREEVIRDALDALEGMTLTVIEGDFPRDVIAEKDLTFLPFQVPSDRLGPDGRVLPEDGPGDGDDGRDGGNDEDDGREDGRGSGGERGGDAATPLDGDGGMTAAVTVLLACFAAAAFCARILRP